MAPFGIEKVGRGSRVDIRLSVTREPLVVCRGCGSTSGAPKGLACGLADRTGLAEILGGRDLGAVDLGYVPEPASARLLAVGFVIGLFDFRRSDR